MLILIVILQLLIVAGLIALVARKPSVDTTPIVDLLRAELMTGRSEAREANRAHREELAVSMQRLGEGLQKATRDSAESQGKAFKSFESQVKELVEANERRMGKIQETVEQRLQALSEGNEKKLEQMREVVEEKLQSTLEKRLDESFKRVSENLEAVQRGLGEMQTLANDVGGLQRILTNVKVRGTWGEVQLGGILEQILTSDQYECNARVNPDSSERVEFAVRLPGLGSDADRPVYLPIDSKFPQEDYQRLCEASERADAEETERAARALQAVIRTEAKRIREKYIRPPFTTDFAILFLPTEGLYAEVIRQQALVDELQTTHRVMVAGPTTLSALLSSLRVGFRTLAIEQRSSEVWELLSAVKTEFGKFGGVLDQLHKQVGTVSNTIESAQRRTRVMNRKLRDVEQIDEGSAERMLSLAEMAGLETEDEVE